MRFRCFLSSIQNRTDGKVKTFSSVRFIIEPVLSNYSVENHFVNFVSSKL